MDDEALLREAPGVARVVAAVDRFDRRALRRTQRLRRPALDVVFLAASYSGAGPVWFGAAGVLVLLRRMDWVGIPELDRLLAGMLGAFVSLVIGQALKRVVRRQRPYLADDGDPALGILPRDHSMPSTHTATAVALAVALIRCGHPWAEVVTVWAGLVVFSRYYIGVHYPSDLLAGGLLGVACGLVSFEAPVRWVVG